MRSPLILVAAAVAVGGALLAPAGLASADDSAQNTINYWENQGYRVNIDRVGSAHRQSRECSRGLQPFPLEPGLPVGRVQR